MAHNLTIRADGKAEFFSLRQSAWHGLGNILPDEITDGRVLEAAGLNWNVQEVPVGTVETTPLPGGDSMTAAVAIPGYKALRRSDNALALGIVGQAYRTFQNQEMVDLMRAVAGIGHIVWETAGSLNGGRTVWALARLPDLAINVKGDPSNAYMLASNGHGNQRPLVLMPTLTRVVCANTMRAAMGTTKDQAARAANGEKLDTTDAALCKGYSINHTVTLDKQVSQVSQAYHAMTAQAKATEALCIRLADVRAHDADVRAYWDMVLRLAVPAGLDEKARVVAMRRQERTLAAMDAILAGPTSQEPGTVGTWYNAYQAVVEYVDHRPDRAQDGRSNAASRLTGATWGEGATIKADAWRLALANA